MSSEEEIRRKRIQRLNQLAQQNQQNQQNQQSQNNVATSSEQARPKEPTNRPENPVSATAEPSKLNHALSSSTSSGTSSANANGAAVKERTGDSTPREPISFEKWEHNTIRDVLLVTLDGETTDRSLVRLTGLAQELREESIELVLSQEVLDRVMWSRISEHGGGKPFDYLLSSWSRASSIKRVTRSTDPLMDRKVALLNEIQTLCTRYAVLVTTNPDIVEDLSGGAKRSTTVDQLVEKQQSSASAAIDFLQATINHAHADEELLEYASVLIKDLSHQLLFTGYVGNYRPFLMLMEVLVGHKQVAALITQIDGFAVKENANAVSIVPDTLLGPFLAISPLDGNGPLKNFPSPDTIMDHQVRQLQNDIRSEYKVIKQMLFNICNNIVRGSAQSRQGLLAYFGKVLNMNHRRLAIMQTQSGTVSPDGFLMNITYILMRLSEPFSGIFGGKFDKVSFDYFKNDPVFDITEETKINADNEESKRFYDSVEEDQKQPSNFISHCFYLTCAYIHYGLGGTVQSNVRIKRSIDDLARSVEHFEMELQRMGARNNPQLSGPMIDRFKNQLKLAKAKKFSLEVEIFDLDLQVQYMQFILFQMVILLRAAEPGHQYPAARPQIPFPEEEPAFFKNLPEYLLESAVAHTLFLSREFPHVITKIPLKELVVFLVAFMRNTSYIKNPYLKAKLVEILFFGSLSIQGRPGLFMEIYDTEKICLDHLLHAMMNFYIECEQTGASSQFYDKFNIRYHISQILKSIWTNSTYQRRLEEEAQQDPDFFVRFVALLLNDTTYLFDESLSKLLEIHKLQKELPPEPMPGSPPESQEVQEQRRTLASTENQSQSYMQLTNQTSTLVRLFTEAIPKSFVTSEIVDRLAAMLNYNLVTLVGPKCRELKVKNPEKYFFNPKELLSKLFDIYLNLSPQESFVEAVARDGRSYDPGALERAKNILIKFNFKKPQQIQQFEEFVRRTQEVKEEDDLGDVYLGDIPDEFLDPLMYTLMKEPVILPSSRVTIDLATIKSHLLSDPKDPFNRAPLKIDEVIPDTELKEKIQEYKRVKKEEYEQKMQIDG
ncbi:E4 ubiquitin-protein ligase Ufd2p [Trichomonascus vanleenenianus]|uniref:ubiquitin-ubiquitin ligase UFD2 n=1 Tax=Trichomonascus vanleenenianus TaxID=2268995 RepID=UPI003ECA595F